MRVIVILMTIVMSLYGAIFFQANSYINGMLQCIFLFGYFEVAQLFVLKIISKYKRPVKISTKCVILGAACALSFICRNQMQIVFPASNVGIEITALAEKNPESQGMEVWISNIRVDNNDVDLSETWQDSTWRYDMTANSIVGNPVEGASTIEFYFDKAKEIQVSFGKHAWSGMVEVGIKDEAKEVLDLYYPTSDGVTYVIKVPEVTSISYTVLSCIASILLFYSIIYIVYACRKQKIENRNDSY